MHADEEMDWYSIEFIVFENNPLGKQTSEPWIKEAFVMPSEAIELGEHSDKKAFHRLNKDQQHLQGAFEKLSKVSSYIPILHDAWIQPLEEDSPLQAIKLIQESPSGALEGVVTFHRGRYLHLDFDLQLTEAPVPFVDNGLISSNFINRPTVYRLNQTRRLKTGDIQYFDHPRFGVIAVIEKIANPDVPLSLIEILEKKKSAAASSDNVRQTVEELPKTN
jgi:hypothetical protein